MSEIKYDISRFSKRNPPKELTDMLVEMFRLGVTAQPLPASHLISFEKSVDTFMGRSASMTVKLWNGCEYPDIIAHVWIYVSDRSATGYLKIGNTKITIEDDAMFKSAWRKELDVIHDLYHENKNESKNGDVNAAIDGLRDLLEKFRNAVS